MFNILGRVSGIALTEDGFVIPQGWGQCGNHDKLAWTPAQHRPETLLKCRAKRVDTYVPLQTTEWCLPLASSFLGSHSICERLPIQMWCIWTWSWTHYPPTSTSCSVLKLTSLKTCPPVSGLNSSICQVCMLFCFLIFSLFSVSDIGFPKESWVTHLISSYINSSLQGGVYNISLL